MTAPVVSPSAPGARTALVAGASGAVGQALVQILLDHAAYRRVKVLVRKPLALRHPKLETLLLPAEGPAALAETLAADDVFCCLGTTQKQAGSQAAFERVDYHLVLDVARSALAAGATQFVVLSSLGAALRSPSFYSRVKGRMEQAVLELPYRTIHVLRPSLLLTGARAEARPAEWLAQQLMPLLNPLLRGRLARMRAIAAEDVAAAMVTLALRDAHGGQVHHLPLGVDDPTT
jgi:uncharacterized protein YbjT (DUF2867 family)